MGYEDALLVGLVGCLVAAGCSWTDSDARHERATRPVAIRIEYTKLERSGATDIANVSDRTRVEVAPYGGGRARVIARRAGQPSWNR